MKNEKNNGASTGGVIVVDLGSQLRQKIDIETPTYVGNWDSGDWLKIPAEFREQPERGNSFGMYVLEQKEGGLFVARMLDIFGWADCEGKIDNERITFTKQYEDQKRRGALKGKIFYDGVIKKAFFKPEYAPQDFTAEFVPTHKFDGTLEIAIGIITAEQAQKMGRPLPFVMRKQPPKAV